MIPLEGRGHTRGSPISLLPLHKINDKAAPFYMVPVRTSLQAKGRRIISMMGKQANSPLQCSQPLISVAPFLALVQWTSLPLPPPGRRRCWRRWCSDWGRESTRGGCSLNHASRTLTSERSYNYRQTTDACWPLCCSVLKHCYFKCRESVNLACLQTVQRLGIAQSLPCIVIMLFCL